MKNPKVSIIVPVYKAELTLARCVDSILAQTYTDFELLLIDDGSPDNSGVLCDEYAKKDSRVRVFHKPNGGVSSARNLGLDNANGEWITFIDADDSVTQSFLKNLEANCKDDYDIIMILSNYIFYNGKIEKEDYPSRIIHDDIDILFNKYDFAWRTSPWGKFYRKEIISNLRFSQNMHLGEDAVFLYEYICRCHNIIIINSNDYNYYLDNPNSLTKKIYSVDIEEFLYNQIYRTTNDLIKKRVRTSSAITALGWLQAYYIGRVLSSIYYTKLESRKKRISRINKLDLKTYTKCIGSTSLKEKFLISLLKYRLLTIYDFIRYSAMKLRKR